MPVIGLTGGVASGKSTVSRMLSELGAYVIDADLIARQVVEPGREAWKEVADAFGEGVLNPDRTINRKALGDIVFNDREALSKLNSIIHPRVIATENEQIKEIQKREPQAIIVLDIPLLIETGGLGRVEKLIVVVADEDRQIERLVERRGLSREEAMKRIRTQMPLKEKAKFADYVIDNNGTLEATLSQVKSIWKDIQKGREV
jgi:dephospho-CoA kinase